eukprot:500177-Prymnesium_polylepis.1
MQQQSSNLMRAQVLCGIPIASYHHPLRNLLQPLALLHGLEGAIDLLIAHEAARVSGPQQRAKVRLKHQPRRASRADCCDTG